MIRSHAPYVREAGRGDAAALARLAEETFRDTYAADNTPEDLEAYVAAHFGEAHQAAELYDPAMVTWLAVADGGPDTTAVGYLQLRRDASCPVAGMDGAVAEVARCYVHRSWHGHGVGRALIDAAVARARREGVGVLWLSVWKRNPRAIAFYRKCGFVVVGDATFRMGSDVQSDHVMALRVVP